MNNLFEELEKRLIKPEKKHNAISVTGGGGKTSLLTEFGRYLRDRGYSVILTTTTRIAGPARHDYRTDYIFHDRDILEYKTEKGRSVLYAEPGSDPGKWSSPAPDVLSELYTVFDVMLIEADGSRGLPLKIHTERDPVILPFTDSVVGVMGLWGIGCKANDAVFGDDRDVIVDDMYIDSYLRSENGLIKGMSSATYNAVILNGMDINPSMYSGFISRMGSYPLFDILAASIRRGEIYNV